ncbi:hypothetical protein Q0Z83_067660 [Actinoplanes sichuanensis]|uniref:Serine/threonine protein kinase n=1 Tax=Actinoplanes sichuanensis TaxID=512349 RepID=A0ABW4ACA2_9ACTN|nr:hypothetical protein [Actinoplanes sichuanensis]BEL08575.1 hypothetical protein Q0Z83_067660 [Actinoplanes sichuanensis]
MSSHHQPYYTPTPPPPAPKRAAWLFPVALTAALLAVGGTVFFLLTNGDEPEPVAALPEPATTTPAAPPAVPTPARGITTAADDETGNTVGVSCFLASNVGPRENFTIKPDRNGRHDFSPAWNAEGYFCDVIEVGGSQLEIVNPVSDREQTALRASEYADDDIASLFAICADVNPAEDFLKPGYQMTTAQVSELTGALVLCPDQPLSAKWRQLIQREDRPATAGGAVGDGPHRVGRLVKAGTYTAVDEDGCYWERQSGSGKVVESRFVAPGAKATVTVRTGDTLFLSAGCGEWRRAG